MDTAEEIDSGNVSARSELVSIEEIPAQYHSVFAEYSSFNVIQSKLFNDVFHSDKSIVLSSPTGSGKTVIFELAILRLLHSLQQSSLDKTSFKIIYLSPMKALCEERSLDWRRKFRDFDIEAVQITGDSDQADISDLGNFNLIIATPEKWDSLTRKWRDNINLVHMIKLFMIDEVHLVNEEVRGATLESVVCRMKTIEKMLRTEEGHMNIRFVAVSATIANVDDVADWIGERGANVKAYHFGEEYRPVPLQKIVLGYLHRPNISYFKFELCLNYKLPKLIETYANGRPVLIFCTTRKSAEMTAQFLYKNITLSVPQQVKDFVTSCTEFMSNVTLKSSLINGIGYHHAGLLLEMRRSVEQLFRDGKLPILVTTSTLALGLNLPAHLVIVKSTKMYKTGEAYRDYTKSHLLQMIGRAGRPQFDTTATAIIMTTIRDRDKFNRMLDGLEPIESNLHRHLTDHVNAEVALKTITHLDVAVQWINSSFLYVRAMRNPALYGLPAASTKDQVQSKLTDLLQIEVNKLANEDMLRMDEDVNITPTEIGCLMAKYYIAFDTMKLFRQMSGHEVLQQLLNLISQCYEFSDMFLRVSEKKCLNLLNKCTHGESIRFPLTGKINSLPMKINCIIQAVLGCLDITEVSLVSESLQVMRSADRISQCMFQYLKIRPQSFRAFLNSIILQKCISAKLWENSAHVSKQLSGIGNVMSAQLARAGIDSFKKMAEMESRDIEMVLHKKPPFGNAILNEVRNLPRFKLELIQVDTVHYHLILTLANADDLRCRCTVKSTSIMHLVVGDSLNNVLLYKSFNCGYLINQKVFERNFQVSDEKCCVEAHLISADWVGFDATASVNMEEVPVQEQVPKSANPAKPAKVTKPAKHARNVTVPRNKTKAKTPVNPPTVKTVPYMESFRKLWDKVKPVPEEHGIVSDLHGIGEGTVSELQQNEERIAIQQTEPEPVETSVNGTKMPDDDVIEILDEPPISKPSTVMLPNEERDLTKYVLQRKTFGATENNSTDGKCNHAKITWRTPIATFSPPVKFAPKFDQTHTQHPDSSKNNAEIVEVSSTPRSVKSSGSRKSTIFSLTDVQDDFQYTDEERTSEKEWSQMNHKYESPSAYCSKLLSEQPQHKKAKMDPVPSARETTPTFNKKKSNEAFTSDKDLEERASQSRQFIPLARPQFGAQTEAQCGGLGNESESPKISTVACDNLAPRKTGTNINERCNQSIFTWHQIPYVAKKTIKFFENATKPSESSLAQKYSHSESQTRSKCSDQDTLGPSVSQKSQPHLEQNAASCLEREPQEHPRSTKNDMATQTNSPLPELSQNASETFFDPEFQMETEASDDLMMESISQVGVNPYSEGFPQYSEYANSRPYMHYPMPSNPNFYNNEFSVPRPMHPHVQMRPSNEYYGNPGFQNRPFYPSETYSNQSFQSFGNHVPFMSQGSQSRHSEIRPNTFARESSAGPMGFPYAPNVNFPMKSERSSNSIIDSNYGYHSNGSLSHNQLFQRPAEVFKKPAEVLRQNKHSVHSSSSGYRTRSDPNSEHFFHQFEEPQRDPVRPTSSFGYGNSSIVAPSRHSFVGSTAGSNFLQFPPTAASFQNPTANEDVYQQYRAARREYLNSAMDFQFQPIKEEPMGFTDQHQEVFGSNEGRSVNEPPSRPPRHENSGKHYVMSRFFSEN